VLAKNFNILKALRQRIYDEDAPRAATANQVAAARAPTSLKLSFN
jgi:hypothetical protein